MNHVVWKSCCLILFMHVTHCASFMITHVMTIAGQKDIIICKTDIMKWFYSLCHRDLWLFSFLFWFLFDFLCSNHCSPSPVVLFNSHNSYFLLLITCVHSLLVCTCHCDFSACYYAWKTFLIFSTHCSQCTSIISRLVAPF
jgi:hypothetical protein